MKIVFFGSDDFAAAHLRDVIASPFTVCGCVTQPDRPKGRGMKLNVSPVKVVAEQHAVPVLQPDSLLDPGFLKALEAMGADLFVVIAYGRFLTPQLLTMPPAGAINLHPSLLPRYRGAAPINWAIIRGETRTGISIIRLNKRMDAGDVIAQTDVDIRPEDTAVTLRERMVPIGCDLLRETIDKIGRDACPSKPQDPGAVTLAPKLTKAAGQVLWDRQTAGEIHNLVRGLLPWPTAYTTLAGKTVKLLSTEPIPGETAGNPGEIIAVDKESLTVRAAAGAVKIWQVHPESAKAMSAGELIRGYHLHSGQKVG